MTERLAVGPTRPGHHVDFVAELDAAQAAATLAEAERRGYNRGRRAIAFGALKLALLAALIYAAHALGRERGHLDCLAATPASESAR